MLYRISYSTIIRSSNIFFHCYCIMHKSIRLGFTFGLLASSLVMLTVMPFLNNNSFSPTEAKAESEYGMDNYKKYKDSSNVEEIIECSNTNVNNNGFNGVLDDTLPTALEHLPVS